jgi:hypothetical protein
MTTQRWPSGMERLAVPAEVHARKRGSDACAGPMSTVAAMQMGSKRQRRSTTPEGLLRVLAAEAARRRLAGDAVRSAYAATMAPLFGVTAACERWRRACASPGRRTEAYVLLTFSYADPADGLCTAARNPLATAADRFAAAARNGRLEKVAIVAGPLPPAAATDLARQVQAAGTCWERHVRLRRLLAVSYPDCPRYIIEEPRHALVDLAA